MNLGDLGETNRRRRTVLVLDTLDGETQGVPIQTKSCTI